MSERENLEEMRKWFEIRVRSILQIPDDQPVPEVFQACHPVSVPSQGEDTLSNQYTVYAKDDVEITLEESSCKFELCTTLEAKNGTLVRVYTHRMEEGEVIELVSRLLGPLYYFNPTGDLLVQLRNKLKEYGYI